MGVLQGQNFIRGRHSKPPFLPLIHVLDGLSSQQLGAIDLMGTFYNSILRVAKEELSFEVLFQDILVLASYPMVKAVVFDNFSLQAGQDSPVCLEKSATALKRANLALRQVEKLEKYIVALIDLSSVSKSKRLAIRKLIKATAPVPPIVTQLYKRLQEKLGNEKVFMADFEADAHISKMKDLHFVISGDSDAVFHCSSKLVFNLSWKRGEFWAKVCLFNADC